MISPLSIWLIRCSLYQGATTGDSIDPDKNSTSHRQPIPYFASTNKILGLWDHLDYHLQAKRRGTTTNPYANSWIGFHTNFYEIREVTEWQVKELWKHGPLYGHPLGWHFRKCAYTVSSIRITQATHRALLTAARFTNLCPLMRWKPWALSSGTWIGSGPC